MDPETYVFPQIDSPALKIIASSGVFAAALALVTLLRLWLPGPNWWGSIDCSLNIGPLTLSLAGLLSILAGYAVFTYASYHAWRATREKNTVEDPKRMTANCILDTGYYGRVRHPMYGMFILANAGLGLAMQSIWGLGFSLLSLAAYVFNGVFEERVFMIPLFGDQYRAYIQRVASRFLTPLQWGMVSVVLVANMLGLWL